MESELEKLKQRFQAVNGPTATKGIDSATFKQAEMVANQQFPPATKPTFNPVSGLNSDS
jgi:hypothetical protein